MTVTVVVCSCFLSLASSSLLSLEQAKKLAEMAKTARKGSKNLKIFFDAFIKRSFKIENLLLALKNGLYTIISYEFTFYHLKVKNSKKSTILFAWHFGIMLLWNLII